MTIVWKKRRNLPCWLCKVNGNLFGIVTDWTGHSNVDPAKPYRAIILRDVPSRDFASKNLAQEWLDGHARKRFASSKAGQKEKA